MAFGHFQAAGRERDSLSMSLSLSSEKNVTFYVRIFIVLNFVGFYFIFGHTLTIKFATFWLRLGLALLFCFLAVFWPFRRFALSLLMLKVNVPLANRKNSRTPNNTNKTWECEGKGVTTQHATEGGGSAFLLSRVYSLSVQFVIWQHLKSYAAAPFGGQANQFDFYGCVFNASLSLFKELPRTFR